MNKQPEINDLNEILIGIKDDTFTYYGGNQHWYPSKSHQMSGCGPVAAANITAHLAINFPDKYQALYPYTSPTYTKKDFIAHMVEVRKFVKPGIFGLTSVKQFSENVLSFADSKGVTLKPHFVEEPSTTEEAFDFVQNALKQNLPLALLILTHPSREFSEFTWHWMTIHHAYTNKLTNKRSILISSYGERHLLDFDLLWDKRRSRDVVKMIYFN